MSHLHPSETGDYLTGRQQRFVELYLAGGHTLLEIYQKVSPPRKGQARSRHAEIVEASRLFHHPKVQEAIAAARDRDPIVRRYRALRALARIAEGKLDPSRYYAARALQKAAEAEIAAAAERERARQDEVLEGAAQVLKVLRAAEEVVERSKNAGQARRARVAAAAVVDAAAKAAAAPQSDADHADEASTARELVEVIRRRQAEHGREVEVGRKRRRRAAGLVAEQTASSLAHPPGEFGLPRR